MTTYRKFSSRNEARMAFDSAVRMARMRLKIFDRDGQLYGLDRKACVETLERFLVAERGSELTLIVHDKTYLTEYCPRLLALFHTYAHQFQILVTDDTIKHFDRGLVIVERSMVLRRPHFDHPIVFWDEDASEIQGSVSLFDQIVQCSEAALTVTVTGLSR